MVRDGNPENCNPKKADSEADLGCEPYDAPSSEVGRGPEQMTDV